MSMIDADNEYDNNEIEDYPVDYERDEDIFGDEDEDEEEVPDDTDEATELGESYD